NQGYWQNFGDQSDFVATRSFVDDKDQIDSPASFNSCPLPIDDF
ncbi:hypothetical protein V7128_29170, partial [Neobacillus vireti]